MQLGQKARDKVTGFEGTVTGRAEYLTGCTQYCLAPKTLPDGSIRSAEWFDEGRLETLEGGIAAADVAGERNGGPQRDAPR